MTNLNRRAVLKGSAIFAGASALPAMSNADVVAGRDPYEYEITKTDAAWRAQLGDADYAILREGQTEMPRSSPLWAESSDGHYNCKACDLEQYRSNTKVNLPKGWLFFTASEPNAQLMSQDGNADMSDAPSAFDVYIEVHCRRCGSHIGHILLVEGKVLHCINGASLTFHPSA